jgi:hypothetical protein
VNISQPGYAVRRSSLPGRYAAGRLAPQVFSATELSGIDGIHRLLQSGVRASYFDPKKA